MAEPCRKVLLIDDDSFFLKVMAEAFADSGFAVVTAGSGADGIKAFLTERPDAVVCDLIMPGMGGASTCQEIRRRAGDREPVIALLTSMFKGAPHEHAEPEMGARIHIPKSTHPLNIVIIVEQLLTRRQLDAPATP
jgi:DNA-binding response OmpR family regulator